MLKTILIIVSVSSLVNSQISEAIDAVRNAADGLNKIAIKAQTGNICKQNDNCYPINVLDNLCCNEKGPISLLIEGQCCNMFSYIQEQP